MITVGGPRSAHSIGLDSVTSTVVASVDGHGTANDSTLLREIFVRMARLLTFSITLISEN